jgi:hypothetical protein
MTNYTAVVCFGYFAFQGIFDLRSCRVAEGNSNSCMSVSFCLSAPVIMKAAKNCY